MDADLPESCQVMAWKPAVPGVAEVFHARMVDYRYPRHCHATWAVLLVDEGAVRYDIDTRRRGAVGDTVTILPPGVVHDGRPAERFGRFRKRVLYLDADILPTDLVGRAVDSSTFRDPALRTAISALHDRLAGTVPDPRGVPDPLDVEERLALVTERFRRRLERRPPRVAAPEPALADRLRDHLDARLTDKVTLGEAARHFDRSVPHLVRSFTRRFGISPYAYVTGARVDLARTLLLRGEPPARVATLVGFHDQAHLTRHFTRHVAVPPARYAASGVRRPPRSGR